MTDQRGKFRTITVLAAATIATPVLTDTVDWIVLGVACIAALVLLTAIAVLEVRTRHRDRERRD